MDHADARFQRVKGGAELHLLAVDQDISAIAAGLSDYVHAKENFHQRTLARTIFAAQAKNFTGSQVETDIGKNLVPEEILLDVFHLKQGSAVICHTSALPIVHISLLMENGEEDRSSSPFLDQILDFCDQLTV